MSTQIAPADGRIAPIAGALEQVLPYRKAGFALHWLRERSKAPIATGWSSLPIAMSEALRQSYRDGYNVGVRLGEPSRVAGGYLHCFDIDIRVPEIADECWAQLEELIGVDPFTLPSVVSGSGGESRHLYFVTDRPFYSRKLATSDGKIRRFDRTRGKDVWSYEWEIDLFGTGKQVVFPPSVHPDTGAEYAWERPFDLELLDLGVAPVIPADRLAEITEAVSETYEFEAVEPLTFKEGQLERELDEVHVSGLHYDDWILLGQALHHQFGGSEEGWHLWLKHTRRSVKYDGDDRTMRYKWRSFGRNRRRPVTMATVRQWVLDQRRQAFADAFDDLPEPDTVLTEQYSDTVVDDLLGGNAAAEPAATHDPLDDDVDLPWQSLLDFNPDTGAIRPSLYNVTLMVQHDRRVAGLPRLNLLTQETVQRTPIPSLVETGRKRAKPLVQLNPGVWSVSDPLNGTLWDDSRDNDIRRIFEAPKTQGGYGIKISDRDLTAAVNSVAKQNAFHPIREYLESIEWDGKQRAERLFIDFLGSPDTPYSRDIARLLLIAAVTRVYEPAHKFDFAVIIEGAQGRGKSTFIKTLGQHWFAELDGDFSDSKQMIELMMGKWILEVPELSAFSKADVRNIKAFISRCEDRARLAYARRAAQFQRQCVFIGSTNQNQYLKDDSGARRFWPVVCTVESIDLDRLARCVNQIWGEALALYREMRKAQPKGMLPLFLTREESRTAALEFQETRTAESPESIIAGVIGTWLEKPITTGDLDGVGEGKTRNYTCVKEILDECLKDEPMVRGHAGSQLIGRAIELIEGWERASLRMFPKYGKQRAFRRKVRRRPS